MHKLKTFWDDSSGFGTVEVILILVVLVGLVIIFKKQIVSLVNDILSKVTSQSKTI